MKAILVAVSLKQELTQDQYSSWLIRQPHLKGLTQKSYLDTRRYVQVMHRDMDIFM